jgi:hypothetical protein
LLSFAARQALLQSAIESLAVGLVADLAFPFLIVASADRIALAITAGPSTTAALQGSSR